MASHCKAAPVELREELRPLDEHRLEAGPDAPAVEELPGDWYEDLEEDQLDYASDWEDARADLVGDESRSETPGRGCLVGWICRLRPRPNDFPGCEAACLWTRTRPAARPNCFGFYQSAGLVTAGDLLQEPIEANCACCVLADACSVQTEKRLGIP